mmetsp:Transcript_16097/g.48013  ORF Transcript_16097/g.48013 Transcript_16097/m.48013 type:complete len:207 (+) Transcript_16097:2513-3133(+)
MRSSSFLGGSDGSAFAGSSMGLSWKRSANPGSGDANSSTQGAFQAASAGGARTRAKRPLLSARRPTDASSPSRCTTSKSAWGPAFSVSCTSTPEKAWQRSDMSRNSSGPTCTRRPGRAAHSTARTASGSNSSRASASAMTRSSRRRVLPVASSIASARCRCACSLLSRSSRRQPKCQSSSDARTASMYRSSQSACARRSQARRSSP